MTDYLSKILKSCENNTLKNIQHFHLFYINHFYSIFDPGINEVSGNTIPALKGGEIPCNA